jgi:hypothetical protein
VFIDGQYWTTISSGSSDTKTVSIGQHFVEGAAYYLGTHIVQRQWPPQSVNVPAAGFTELLYCQ